MASWSKVYGEFWADTLDWPDDERIAALYVLTCPQRTTEGLYGLVVGHGAVDLRWEPQRLEAALDALHARGFIVRDGRWVCIVNALRHDPPGGSRRLAGAVRAVSMVPVESPAYAAFVAAARKLCPDLAGALTEPSGSRYAGDGNSIQAVSKGPAGGIETVAVSPTTKGQETVSKPFPVRDQLSSAQAQLSSATTAGEQSIDIGAWLDAIFELGREKRARWASALSMEAEYRQRTSALLGDTTPEIARSVMRDVRDRVAAGRLQNSLPDSVRSFIDAAESSRAGGRGRARQQAAGMFDGAQYDAGIIESFEGASS